MYPKELAHLIELYEGGELGEADTLALFQDLIDTGIAWELQVHYAEQAKDLLMEGKLSWK